MSDVMQITDSRSAPFRFHADRFPRAPGCYLMLNACGEILYVGKANDLRNRLASYFRTSSTPHRKAEMIRRIRMIDLFLVRNEREALVLESNLIRFHLPAYNSQFTHDDDSYYYIARTSEAFPRFVPFRKRRTNYALQAVGEPAALFGPYVGWRLRNRVLDEVRSRFPLRRCHTLPDKACFLRDTGDCAAPCTESITQTAYGGMVSQASRFLRRPPEHALAALRAEMTAASERREFERAADLRDRLSAIEHAASLQVAERCRRGAIRVIYSDGDRGVCLSIADGILQGLEGPSGLRQIKEGIPEDAQIICNRATAPEPQLGSRIRIPASNRSYAGQLLEIARLNFEFRTARPE